MNETIQFLKDYWAIIVFIGGLVASWVKMDELNKHQNEKIKNMCEGLSELKKKEEGYRPYIEFAHENRTRIEKLEKNGDDIRASLKSIEAKLVEISTDIIWIKNK